MFKYKVGERVKVVDENTTATVIGYNKEKVIVLNQFGFEEEYRENEIITENGMVEVDITKEIKFLKEKSNQAKPKIKSSKQENIILLEVDLHIGHLADNINTLTNYQMLQIQIKKIKETIFTAREKKYKTIIFIHGKGKGVLKNELYKILDQEIKVIYFDASFQKYKMGATEVRFN